MAKRHDVVESSRSRDPFLHGVKCHRGAARLFLHGVKCHRGAAHLFLHGVKCHRGAARLFLHGVKCHRVLSMGLYTETFSCHKETISHIRKKKKNICGCLG